MSEEFEKPTEITGEDIGAFFNRFAIVMAYSVKKYLYKKS